MSLGVDLAGQDLEFFFQFKRERDCLAADLVNRLRCTKGDLFYAPNYGINLRSYLGKKTVQGNASRANAEISAELLQDQRVSRAFASFIYSPDLKTATVTIFIQPREGANFRLIVAVSPELVSLTRIA